MKFMCNINIINSSHHLSIVFLSSFSLVFVGLAVFLYLSLNCLQMSCSHFVCIAYSVIMVDCAHTES